MSFTRIGFRQSFFSERSIDLVSDGELKATAFRYETDVAGLHIQNSRSSMVVLPYMGMQVWSVSFDGRDVTQRSMFDIPLATTKFGDNYGAFLYHCGLNNVNGPEGGRTPTPYTTSCPLPSTRTPTRALAWTRGGGTSPLGAPTCFATARSCIGPTLQNSGSMRGRQWWR